MNPFFVTRHAEARAQQRGVTLGDIGLAMEIGTEVDDGFMVLKRDYRQYERVLKRNRARARHLVGKRFVLNGERLLTTYHVNNRTCRRLLQHSKERGLK